MEIHSNLSWETRLLKMAYEGLDSLHHHAVTFDDSLLEAAYQLCERITREHSRTFFLASSLLPKQKRRAAWALYAFCRVTDNIVDNSQDDERLEKLHAWRECALSHCPPSSSLVAVAWADARARFGIPLKYAEQLIAGVAADLGKFRYRTFDELAEYAYGVASTVGLMVMHIIGFCTPRAVHYAVKLGVALQLTNILRDVAEDWKMGHLYLPQEELEHFGLNEADLSAGKVTPAWRDFMRFQIQRVRHLYAQAWPGIALLDQDGRFAIAAAADLYQAILDDIEAHDYDVFSRRAHLSSWAKLRRLPGIWIKTKALKSEGFAS
jgi:phytoene synthase